MEEDLIIYGPEQSAYNIDYLPTIGPHTGKQMRTIPDANDFTNKKSFIKSTLEWENETEQAFSKTILPVPISVSYRFPTQPKILTAQEKVPRSQQAKLAARSFSVFNTPLYPENHLEMQKMVITGIESQGNFPKGGPRNEKIPIENHMKSGRYFNNTFIPMKPQPEFYFSYKEYREAFENWISISKPYVEDVPSSAVIGKMININKVEDGPIYEKGKTEQKEKKCEVKEFKIDERFLNLRLQNTQESNECLAKILFNLRKELKKKQCIQKETESKGIDLSVINTISTEELRNKERHNFLFTMSNYNPSFIHPSFYEKALRMTMHHKTSRHYRFAVFTVVEGLLNRKNCDISYLLKNSLDLIYAFTALIEEFSSVKVTVYDPGPKLIDKNDDEMLLNHAKTALLELSYNKAMLKHFEMKKAQYQNAYASLQVRQTGLKMQATQLINYMSKKLLLAIKNCMCKENAYCIALIVLLIAESECSVVESFLINPTFSFFNILEKLYECSPDDCELLQRRFLFSRVASTTLLPFIFSIFSQLQLNTIKKEPCIVLRFICNMFLIDPRVVTHQMTSFIPFFFAKIVSVIDENAPNIIFETLSQLCLFVNHAVKLLKNDRAQDELIISETLKYLFLCIPFTNSREKILPLLRSIKTLVFLKEAESSVNNMKKEQIKFLLTSVSSKDIDVCLLSWKIVSRLVAENRKFRLKILDDDELKDLLSDASYRPSDACIVYVLSMISESLTKERGLSKSILLQAILSPSQQDYNDFMDIVIAPDVKIESLMRTLISHKSAVMVPMQFHVLHVFKQVLDAMEENKKKNKKKR